MQFLLAVYIKAETRRKGKKHENKRIIGIGKPDRKVQFLPAVYIKTEKRLGRRRKACNKRIILETLTKRCNIYLQCISRLRPGGRRKA